MQQSAGKTELLVDDQNYSNTAMMSQTPQVAIGLKLGIHCGAIYPSPLGIFSILQIQRTFLTVNSVKPCFELLILVSATFKETFTFVLHISLLYVLPKPHPRCKLSFFSLQVELSRSHRLHIMFSINNVIMITISMSCFSQRSLHTFLL